MAAIHPEVLLIFNMVLIAYASPTILPVMIQPLPVAFLFHPAARLSAAVSASARKVVLLSGQL